MTKERQHRRVWTEQQDEILRTYVEQSTNIKKPKWKEISQALNNKLQLQFKRNPKQCRQRWFNSLAPTCQQAKEWDVDDDVTLIQACKKYGHRWSRLAKEFHQSVNDNRLKNHFYSTVRKIVRVINTVVKQSKKQYQNNIKKGTLDHYTEEQLQVMKQICKLRTFQPKLLSKVFSLIDQKQQYRYEAKQSLEVEQLRSINNQVLDYMEDFVTGKNEFTTFRILNMITRVMHVNRTIKTKYIREVKLSIQDEGQIQKEQESRKKREKKINSIVKEELDNKIIPDRRTKIQIINKIGDQNKKLRRLIRPLERRKTKKSTTIDDQLKSQNQLNSIGLHFKNQRQYQQFQIENSQAFNKNQNYALQKVQDRNFQNEQYDQVGTMLNFNLNNDYEANNYLKNSLLYNIGRDRANSPGLNISSIFNFNQMSQNNGFGVGVNNASFNYDQFDKKNNLFQQEKSKSSIQRSQKSRIDHNKINNGMVDQNIKQNNKNANQNPFASNFLNDIPLITSNNEQNKKDQVQDIKQIINPFFPQHKLTHSQGYFVFGPAQPQQVQPPSNDMYKSNPNVESINFIDMNNQKGNSQSKIEGQSNKGLRNSRLFQGLLGSINYSSNNDKASQQSQKMKCSLFDLIPNFHPMHTSAFCPIFLDSKDNLIEPPKQNRYLEASKPFSAHNGGQKFNIQQSIPIGIQLYRSSDILHESNPSGTGMYHSCSYGQKSQSNKSNRSKKK